MDASRCTATSKRSGEQCGRPKAPGAEVCHMHGAGSAKSERGQRRIERVQAKQQIESLSIPVDTTPEDALLGEVRHVAGDVAFLRKQVVELGGNLTQHVSTQGGGGYEAPDVWVDMYWQAHDRLVKVTTAAIKAGVEERKVRVAEREMDAVAQAIDATLRELGVDVTPEVGATLGRHLRAI